MHHLYNAFGIKQIEAATRLIPRRNQTLSGEQDGEPSRFFRFCRQENLAKLKQGYTPSTTVKISFRRSQQARNERGTKNLLIFGQRIAQLQRLCDGSQAIL